MRNDLIELLALLVSVGYIKSFRVTKNYIYVTMKNDRQYEEYSVPARKRRSEKLSELRYAAAVLRDMKESTKDGAFVQVGAYWYEVQDLTKSIEAIKEAIEEAENEEAG